MFVGYHDYVGNDGEELAAMTALAQELGFRVRHKIARLYPLEKALPLYDQAGVPAASDRRLYDLLLVKPVEWSRVARQEAPDDRSCLMREQEMALNYDGSVALCCNVYDYANNIAPDFLSVSHAELQARKDRHPLCGRA